MCEIAQITEMYYKGTTQPRQTISHTTPNVIATSAGWQRLSSRQAMVLNQISLCHFSLIQNHLKTPKCHCEERSDAAISILFLQSKIQNYLKSPSTSL